MSRIASLLFVLIVALGTASMASAQQPSRQQRVEQARQLFMEGLQAYQRGELHIAVQKLLASQRSWRSPETAFNIARCFERMGETARANHWFRAYLTHGRPDARTRADIEHRMQLMNELQARVESQATVPGPSDDEMRAEARRFFESGMNMYRRRRYEAAMQAFVQAFRFQQFPELLFNMGAAAEKLGQINDAIGYYQLILDDHREDASASVLAEAEQKIRELRARRQR